MANFDEGGVFYSDQQFVSAGAVHDEAPTLTPQQAIVKFGEFLRTFQVDNKSSVFPYSDQLSRNTGLLRVDLAHLSHPVYGIPDLAAALVENANEHLPLFEQAAALEARRIQALEADGQEPTPKEVQILLFKSGRAGAGLSMRDVKPELYVSKLVIVPCIVTAASRPSHKATHVSIQCRSCRHTLRLPCRPGMGGVALPRKCQGSEAGPSLGVAANQCGLDPYAILSDRVECQDQQNLKLQERPEDVPAGDLPRSMLGVVERALVGCLTPGTRVTAVGILSIFAQKEGAGGAGGREAVAVRQPYLRIVGFQEDVLRGDGSRVPTFSAEEEASFREFAASPLCQQRLFEAMAPAIYGHEDIKKALACLLFGGARKKLPDGTRRRGDVNVLLLGDPSTAKSQFLKFVSRAAPVAVYTSGKGSSAAGLTASVIRDARSREFYLEGGAMVLADGGVVCIDEFDKMRVEDRVAIHEAMEQQTISIAKAGITTMLRSRTAVLAAANPPSGRYDDLASAQENVDLQSTILSRFDLIFIVRDERSAARDAAIARHVLDVHRRAAEGGAREEADELDAAAGAAGLSAEGDAGAGEVAFFKRYVEYARAHCSPRVTESASRLLASEYVEIRAEAQRAAAAGGADVPAVPITVRQLEALVRLSESLARMTLSSEAGESHVRQALELFKVSTMDAVRAGVVDAVVFTEGQRAELRRVEEQVRRRVAIGSHVAERKLVEDLARVGFAESLVRKALLFMQGAGEMEYRRERRLVHRVK